MERFEAEVTPDIILPAQFYARPFGGARIQPEKRLQVAVLADAVLTFHKWGEDERARGRRLSMETEAWFASDDADGPFTFVAICDSLKLDPSYIRRGLGWRSHLEATTGEPKQSPRLRRVA